MTAKLYGFDRSFLHDTTERDPFVIDMVRADDYLKLEAKIAALQEQLSRYSMGAGQADQRKSESDAVRVALGFTVDADDVAPCDLVDAIAALQEQVRSWENENAEMRSAINQTIGWQESVDPSNGESVRMLVGLITPNTDAAIREIMAQAVEDFTDSDLCGQEACGQACAYAARIRSGEQP